MSKKIKFREGVLNLAERLKERINNEDQDVLIIFYGDTGSGKSLSAMQLGYLIDDTFKGKGALKRVCFDKDEFVTAVTEGKKGQVIIADEAISIAFSRAAMSKDSRLVMELLAQMRQKNLCVIMNIPDVTMIDRTVQDKAGIIFEVYELREKHHNKHRTIKGNLKVYADTKSRQAKTSLIHYLRAAKNNPNTKTKRPKPLLINHGSPIGERYAKPWYPVPEKLYREKKESILQKYKEKDKPKENKDKIRAMNFVYSLHKKGLTQLEIGKLGNLPRTTVKDWIQAMKQQEKGTSS